DLRKQVSLSDMSRRFHNGLAMVMTRLATIIREERNINRVCLSGGCFQNVLLFELVLNTLRIENFDVYVHSVVPPGDGGISLGQALVRSEEHTSELQSHH